MNQDPDDVKLEIIPKKDSDSSGEKADATVYTFGFGNDHDADMLTAISDHDADMLTAISDAGNGMYYYIENEDKVYDEDLHFIVIYYTVHFL